MTAADRLQTTLLLVLVAFAVAATTFAPPAAAACNDDLLDGNETDVDCGGAQCGGCPESKQCLVDSDCDVPNGGCARPSFAPAGANGICFNTTSAERTTVALLLALVAIFLLFAFHFRHELKGRYKAFISMMSRTENQAAKAERERKAAIARAKELAVADGVRRDFQFGVHAYMLEHPELAQEDMPQEPAQIPQSLLPPGSTAAGVLSGSSSAEVELDELEVDSKTAAVRQSSNRAMAKLDAAADGGADPSYASASDSDTDDDDDDDDDEGPPPLAPARAAKSESALARRSPTYEQLVEIGRAAAERAEELRQVHRGTLVKINVHSKTAVGIVRQSMSIINARSSIERELTLDTVTKLRILAVAVLHRHALVGMPADQVKSNLKDLLLESTNVLEAVELLRSEPDRASRKMREALATITKLSEGVRSPRRGARAEWCSSVLDSWKLTDKEFLVAQADAESSMLTDKERVAAIYERVMLARGAFVSPDNVELLRKEADGNKSSNSNKKQSNNDDADGTDEKPAKPTLRQRLPALLRGAILSPSVRAYPYFYAVFFLGLFIVFIRFFSLVGSDSNKDVQDAGTFLPVPPYYQLDKHKFQRFWVPFLYAVMHSALYCFCWIPVAFWRGVWRDLAKYMPRLRRHVPIDDMVYFHKMLGILILIFLFLGAWFFYIALADECRGGDHQSCRGFDALDGTERDPAFTHNPFKNVVALRKTVTLTWFIVFPMLHWAHVSPPTFLPHFVQAYWYEFVYYSHHLIAHVSLVTALICRFDVFYPALLTWGIYYIDFAREYAFSTYTTQVAIHPQLQANEAGERAESTSIHTDEEGKPTLVDLRLDMPVGFRPSAGQVVYLKIPEISPVEWHPFSVASASNGAHLELQIGVISGTRSQWERTKEGAIDTESTSLLDDRDSAIMPVVPAGPWRMTKGPTWTYKLCELVRRRLTQMAFLDDPEGQADYVRPIVARVMGPYGSPFTRCFSPHYTGCVIIGAGTGLTAAMSVLRELIDKRRRGKRVPQFVWFVWSCRRADDILWVWEAMHNLLIEAVRDGVVRPGPAWTPTESNMLDWISSTVYVTRANKETLDAYVAAFAQRKAAEAQQLVGGDPSVIKAAAPSAMLRQLSSTDRNTTSSRADPSAVSVEAAEGEGEDEKSAEGVSNGSGLRHRRGADANGDAGDAGDEEDTHTHPQHGRGHHGPGAALRRLALTHQPSPLAEVELQSWLSTPGTHLIEGSMDNEESHIGKLLAWARVYVNRRAGKKRKLAVCFCGPPALAHSIRDAAAEVGSGLEFSAEHQ